MSTDQPPMTVNARRQAIGQAARKTKDQLEGAIKVLDMALAAKGAGLRIIDLAPVINAVEGAEQKVVEIHRHVVALDEQVGA